MKKSAFVLVHTDSFCDKEKMRVLMSFRANSKFGFVGGAICGDENPLDAAIREVQAEVGYDISSHQNDLKLFSNFIKDEEEVMCYSLYLPVEEVKHVMKTWINAPRAKKEVQGVLAVGINEATIANLFKNQFSGTCKEELKLFLNNQGFTIH